MDSQAPNIGNLPYDAFISYKRAPLDTAVAERLITLLEGYRVPATLIKAHRGQIKPRIRRVFRDREELHASPNLQQSLEDALANSRFLIVVCSPGAARSPWVCREIELFGRRRGPEFVLPLLIDGEPNAELDYSNAAFPPPLTTQLIRQTNAEASVVPLAADIRNGSGPASRRKALAALRSEVLRLLAPMLGCTYDELVRRHHQRLVKRALAVAGGLTSILFVIAVSSILALLAERQTTRATEDMLVTQNRLLSAMDPGADNNRRWIFVHNIEQEMQDFRAATAAQKEWRQKILSYAYGVQMMLAKEEDETQYYDEALEKVQQQKIPLAIAQLSAFHPTFLSDLADLWARTKTLLAAWVAEQKPVNLRFQADTEIEIWQKRLDDFDQLSDAAVTAKWAIEHTLVVAEFLRKDLLDLSVADGRTEARRLLQRCAAMWALAAQKQPLTEQEQALVLEVQRGLRRLGDN